MFGLHRQIETGTVFIAMFGLHRPKQAPRVQSNVWVAQTERDTVFITMFGLHRQIETDTMCSSQCFDCTDR